MNLELIKVGHTYYAPVEVTKISNGDVHVVPIHVYQPEELEEIPNPYRHVHSECSSTELTNLLKIKRGDRVKVVERFGLKPWSINWDNELEPSEALWDVDEVDAYGFAQISRPGRAHESVFFIFLELVTAKEDLEPYMVKELQDSFIVYHDCTKIVLNDTSLVCKFMKASHTNAKAAAEAECARLNAAHRKERS